jgi:hypothetical protein
MVQNTNPLVSFMRQPKVYISLPSQGQYYPKGSLEMPENNQLAVYSMTAKDELMLNVPDALMNGQAVVDVIQHCIPSIKNAWEIPSIDLDLILLSIRLATYGEMMKTNVTLKDGSEYEYQVDLRIVMDSLFASISWEPAIPINPDMTIFVRPVNYKQMTKTAIQTFETQKIMQAVNNEQLSEDQKNTIFKESFQKLTEVTIDVIAKSIFRIETSNGTVDDSEFIKEFIENSDKEIFNRVQKHLEDLKNQNSIKPMIVEVTDEMRANGVTGDTIEIPLVFDPANFFASGF